MVPPFHLEIVTKQPTQDHDMSFLALLVLLLHFMYLKELLQFYFWFSFMGSENTAYFTYSKVSLIEAEKIQISA